MLACTSAIKAPISSLSIMEKRAYPLALSNSWKKLVVDILNSYMSVNNSDLSISLFEISRFHSLSLAPIQGGCDLCKDSGSRESF